MEDPPTVITASSSSAAGACNLTNLQQLLHDHPLPSSSNYQYGTAGFRYPASILPPIMIRVGIAASLIQIEQCRRRRSRHHHHHHGNDTTTTILPSSLGIMITASHNEESYNGIKVADTNGGMLAPHWEQRMVDIVNQHDTSKLLQQIQQQQQQQQTVVMNDTNTNNGRVGVNFSIHLGHDTRVHSPSLCQLVITSIVNMGGTVVFHGCVTTPMLHHVVLHGNNHSQSSTSTTPKDNEEEEEEEDPITISQGLIVTSPNRAGYYQLLRQSYTKLLATHTMHPTTTTTNTLLVDCACGVGYEHLQYLVQQLELSSTRIVVSNPPGSGPLNQNCGSEFVQKAQQAPTWYDIVETTTTTSMSYDYCAALDGDADRIVFFSAGTNGFTLLDGDKIACLICSFLQEQLSLVEHELQHRGVHSLRLPTLGVVQTAYANGASTSYLQNILSGPSSAVRIAKTGVKYVHAAAHEFDIGVYFEANGHGTVLFGKYFYEFINKATNVLINPKDETTPSSSSSSGPALRRLRVLPSLINQAVGDALSDLLLVDAILQLQNLSLSDWNAMYTDLPSRQLKVRVADRTVVQVNDNETQCLQPAELQTHLDVAMKECGNGRAFVRPSGTEDVVRVYAEAPTQRQADTLANRAAQLVYQLCQGIGDPPQSVPSSRI